MLKSGLSLNKATEVT